MSYEFRLPNIVGNDKEQLQALKSYLYQFIPQLQWALNTINAPQASGNVVSQSQVRATQTTDSLDPVATFAALKPLIIKSAEIVEAYYDVIVKNLEGLYVAESDFGTYVEQTNLRIEANSQGITQTYDDVQVIISDEIVKVGETIDGVRDEVGKDIDGLKKDVGEVTAYIVDTKAYIKTGKIDEENGIPIYGIEVGQTDEVNREESFRKYARFTSSRLSFFDQNDTEVAYISDYKLNIRNAEITESFQEGGYKDFISTNGGIVTKWVGGS